MSRKSAKSRRPRAELKPELIALAEQITVTEGMNAVTARRLADGAGISVGTIYNLFGHLDGVLRAVNLASMTRLRAAMASALNAADPGQEARLIALAEAYFDFALTHPNRWELMCRFSVSSEGDAAVDAAERALFTLLERALGDAQDPELLRTLWAALHGVSEMAVRRQLSGVEPDGARGYARLIVRAGLRGTAAVRRDARILRPERI